MRSSFIHCVIGLSCCGAVLPAAASSEPQRIYRCGNAYTNQPDPAANCKPLAGGSVTVIEGTRVQSASFASPQVNASGGTSAGAAKVDSAEQRQRDTQAQAVLQAELEKHSSNMPRCCASGTTVNQSVVPMSSVSRKNTKTVWPSCAVRCNARRRMWRACSGSCNVCRPPFKLKANHDQAHDETQ